MRERSQSLVPCPRPPAWLLACVVALAAGGPLAAEEAQKPPLPRPAVRIPDLPPLLPAVVTAGGRRLLLSHTDVAVRYDTRTRKLVSNKPGWWVINYPLDRIRGLEGRTPDQAARILFGRPVADVRNWYLRSPGTPAPEPPEPEGPAPIEPTPNPTLVVAPDGADTNAGTPAAPLKSIGAALARAKPGTVIHVRPGIYRESVALKTSGTAEKPIRLEGIRGADGRMPVITGNDPFPPGAWKPVPGLPGVYRADLFTGQLGTASVEGKTLIERSVPQELKPGEYCLNRASDEFLRLRCEGQQPAEGQEVEGKRWRRAAVDGEGFLDLGAAYGKEVENAVIWASAWVWVEPRARKDVVWDPRFPQPITGQVEVAGEFRAARMSGTDLKSQVNKYRVWANGERLPAVVYSHKDDMQLHLPHPHRNYGFSDKWQGFRLNEGWNHLLFQFDTTCRPEKLRFRFGTPKGVDRVITSAAPPADRAKATAGAPCPYISEYLLLGPFPGKPDRGIYVRLPGDADPDGAGVDVAARGGALVDVQADFVQVRGFEIRHGAQFQQRAQVNLQGEGILLEGCLIRDSEVKGISFTCQKDQSAAPIVVRGNWVVNPGNVGIGGSGSSENLTPGNQDALVPGRSRVVIEHNTITNNNWTGTEPFWESGGMKLFRLTGSVIRSNTIVGGSGPGIWLDWEHFNNRLEGNLFLDAWAFGIGIEASPGPNLVANNVSIDLRPGAVWFRYGVLSWSSDRNLVLHNTIDGRWNKLPAWQNHDGADGIFLYEGRDDRGTRWGALAGRKDVIANNVVAGCHVAVRSRPTDAVLANYTDEGKGAEGIGLPLFLAPERLDCRPAPQRAAALRAAPTEYDSLVTHDFFGLPRFPDEPRCAGAFRAEPEAPQGTQVELELRDGTFLRVKERR